MFQDNLFFVMEYITGGDLFSLIKEKKRFDLVTTRLVQWSHFTLMLKERWAQPLAQPQITSRTRDQRLWVILLQSAILG